MKFRFVLAALAVCAAIVAGFVSWVALGMRAHPQVTGTLSGLRVYAPVTILRDDRGVPHIVAANDHDLFFAQGYVEASDRLFQMDLLRRHMFGDLAEVFGRAALEADERARDVPIRAIVQAQWLRLDAPSREVLGAFSDGVNAAMAREPLPVEFRMLAFRPRAWTPQDSLAVGMATVLDLTDDWDDIEPRDAAYRRGGLRLFNELFPFTDPCYEAPVMTGLSGIGPGDACRRRGSAAALLREMTGSRGVLGSNEWASGAGHALLGHALLANDPHLSLRMPGVWYLVDLRDRNYHVTGASLPGVPGVVLGHNAHVAWGATNGTVASLSVFVPPPQLDPAGWQTEKFGVRFGATVSARYYRTRDTFGVTTKSGRFLLVRWDAYTHPLSPAQTFLSLDSAPSIEGATAALAVFPGPTQNFVLADTTGRVAYVLAGRIPNDPVRARWFHPPGDLSVRYGIIPFNALPKVAPSRNAIVWTANNNMYGRGYSLPLSPQFAPPYRAYRIAQLLRTRPKYDVPFFRLMQMDVVSLPERALARAFGFSWDGRMAGSSSFATAVEALRVRLTEQRTGRMSSVLARGSQWRSVVNPDTVRSSVPWSIAGADPVPHALASLGIDFLDGVTLPGNGDAFTLHMQSPGFSQSFRAVWDVGDWDDGGITLPQGESGEPGSDHYTDQVVAWVRGRLWPLPFSDAAVARTAVDRETLQP
ncbi:MAG: penicillin acylase family protein [Candidatus Cybelea sp.]